MRRFELVEGTSSKFWEIAVEGTGLSVRFGRIGTQGQSQQKAFPTAEKAQAEHDKLVAEKTKKGYAEVGASAATVVAAKPAKTSPAVAKASAPATKAAPPSVVADDAEVAPSAPPLPIVRGPVVATDPSTWPAELAAMIHPSRAWPGPRIALDRVDLWKQVRERAKKSKAKPVPSYAAAYTRLESTEPPTEHAAPSVEAAMVAILCSSPGAENDARWITPGAQLLVDHWVATDGVAKSVKLFASAGTVGVAHAAQRDRLARHVAHSEETEWQAALAAAGTLDDATQGFLFPESGHGDRVVQRTTPQNGYLRADPRAVAAITTQAALETYAKGAMPYTMHLGATYASAEPTAFTLVARFGENVIDPFVQLIDGPHTGAEVTTALARAIGLVSTTRAFETLVARSTDKQVMLALREAAMRTPAVAIGPLAAAAGGRAQSAQTLRALLAQIVRTGDGSLVAAETALPDALRAVIAELRATGGGDREDASVEELPGGLARPRWLGKKPPRGREHATISDLTAIAPADRMLWPAKLRETWARHVPSPWDIDCASKPASVANCARLRSDQLERLQRGESVERDPGQGSTHPHRGSVLAALPPALALAIVKCCASGRWWNEIPSLRKLAADQELTALDALLAYAAHHPPEGLELLLPFASARVAPLAAEALLRSKKAQSAARAWLLAHPEAAIAGLLPVALGSAAKPREAAEHALRFLVRAGHEALVLEVAARDSEGAVLAVREILDFDPLDLVPAKLPSLPDFAVPAALPRPVLRASGKAIPTASMEHVLTMLAISRLDAPYQGVLELREACTPGSLAELGWELFQAWLLAGGPAKEAWAFTQLAFLGDDETARKLAALVRVWPGEAAHARAVTGLDVLATIGTDVALMHLHGISQKLKFKGLQEKAGEKIEAIAETRGLSSEELADRLVPDLGLDEAGTLALDFGPRTFRVAFDEALKPFVRDASGARLGDLPKPRKDDDAEKAKIATDVWKALKKDAKTLASQQITRLELAMCGRRRWTQDVFRRFLLEHPLMRHLVGRLVWGAYSAETDTLLSCFRVAEDGSFADPNDDAWALPEGACVGVVHTLEIAPGDEAKLAQTFGDYEILQPFQQLGRQTYALTEAEKAAEVLQRWKDREVATGSVLGLESRGWRRGEAQDGGVIHWFEREVPAPDGTLLLTLEFEPGVIAGAATEWKEQKLHGVGFGHEWHWRKEASAQQLGMLHPIVASELVRDIELVVAGANA